MGSILLTWAVGCVLAVALNYALHAGAEER